MRLVGVAVGLVVLLTVPSVAAEWGAYGADGWPLDVDGKSTNPFPGSILTVPTGPLNEVAGVTLYPYYPLLTAEVQLLARDHPDLVRVHAIGKSTLGLDLWMIEIADFARIEAGEGVPLDDREVVWVDGGTHSNEYSGVYFVTHLARFLTDEYTTNETARWIVENRHTWILPMVNPDGSHAFGRLNANLVNINRNYPVVWDGEGHDPLMNNRGPEPASEVETRLNIEWFNKTRPDYYASVHCCGNLWLYPYGEEGVDPVDNTTLFAVCQEAFPTVAERCGPIWSTIYPASGSSVDTVYEYTGAVAFGYEMSGRGAVSLWGQPFTLTTVRTQEVESWEGVLHAFLNVHRYGAYPVVADARASGDGIILTLRNEGLGPLAAGNVSFELSAGPQTVALPPLAANARAEVTLPGPFTPGRLDLTLVYEKRLQAAPQGTRTVPLLLVAGDDGVDVAALGDEVLRVDLEAADLDRSEAPSLPAVLVVLVAGALVALTRPRR